jgi:2',3'-cyclic-nucleotide 2'-phosphodiesterase/3'-nucleotidase/5'-nucleotidase
MHKALLGTLAGALASSAAAQLPANLAQAPVFSPPTSEVPMLRGDTAATSQGWTATPIFTIGETVRGYQPTGIFDGMGVYRNSAGHPTVLVTSELNEGNGYAYTLANGTQLTGARMHSMVVLRNQQNDIRLGRAMLAYGTMYDRYGLEVTDPIQVNEDGNAIDGLARFCSAQMVQAGTYGFVDAIFFSGEETGKPFHPHGGSLWALDVEGRALHAVPAVGRGAWENVTPLATGSSDTVALLMGDDTAGAPLYLYIGQKGAAGTGSFLDRNGLAVGQVYAFRADNGDLDPEQFNGVNGFRSGSWVALDVKDAGMAGQVGYDAQGYLDVDTLQAAADTLGCFSFSRPEDLATNPADATMAVFASTGRGSQYPSDNWGTVYIIDTNFDDLSAELVIVHDADGFADPDTGIRSPDNLTWAENGKIYLQEDKSTSPGSLFGGSTGIESSVWELNPVTRSFKRIGEIDRSAVVPAGTTDIGVGTIGHWENSGIIDVTRIFGTAPNERLLLLNVQAHGIRDGAIGDNPLLDEGGQLIFLSKITTADGNDDGQ